jgi:hypothetical protein
MIEKRETTFLMTPALELGDRAEHPADQLGRGRVVDEGGRIVRRDKIDASVM